MIVVFGSVSIDIEMRVARLPRPGESLLSNDYLMWLGRKGANQALAATRAGDDVRLFGMVGAGLICMREGAQSSMPHYEEVQEHIVLLPASRKLA